MKTPIFSFADQYASRDGIRMHMPGHKGLSFLGPEALDITEISGADSLYAPSGIIAESERRTAEIFGAKKTLYSTEGSSQCIRAMLALVGIHADKTKRKPYILAARNAHKAFITAVGLLDFDVRFLPPCKDATLLNAPIELSLLESILRQDAPIALYLTSPDYLGNTAPIKEIAALCHRHGTLLLVDNAHGAYLRFLSPARHPISLGADICCDSAHKTLPALTGAAYLHLGDGLPSYLYEQAKDAMALFGSTSPSYLILESLDLMTEILRDEFPKKLSAFLPLSEKLKTRLLSHGFSLMGDEPLKITILSKAFGYEGTALADILRKEGIECEFSDKDSLVLMLSPYMTEQALERTATVLCALPRLSPIESRAPKLHIPQRGCRVREAMLSAGELLPLSEVKGKILVSLSVGCPPAVAPAVAGEVLDKDTIEIMRYYGITKCRIKI